MARPPCIRATTTIRVPRPRGDGPQWPGRAASGDARSPPTRGWPVQRPAARRTRRAFPAHAGMARAQPPFGAATSCVPRPRGDGPSISRRFMPTVSRSPPTRGWPVVYRALRFPYGSVPRPRGDGPNLDNISVRAPRRSPPTRGWPVSDDASGGARRAFPAHAGMARQRGADADAPVGVPRPRGDGP